MGIYIEICLLRQDLSGLHLPSSCPETFTREGTQLPAAHATSLPSDWPHLRDTLLDHNGFPLEVHLLVPPEFACKIESNRTYLKFTTKWDSFQESKVGSIQLTILTS